MPQIVDSHGDVWTRTSDGTILRNGASTGGAGPQILYCNRIVYAFGTDSQWWRWTGAFWTLVGAVDPCGEASTPNPDSNANPDANTKHRTLVPFSINPTSANFAAAGGT